MGRFVSMNIWIITTGNSDVKLQDKSKWNSLYRQGRRELANDCGFQPAKQEEVSFVVPARVMGVIYGNQLNDENYQDLFFPLLDAFSQQLTDRNKPDRIVVVLTNQEATYLPNPEEKCPYWKDTCSLKPIFDKYFEINFPEVESIEYLVLKPNLNEEGLDNWDKALALVEQELSQLEVNKMDKIFVSHQAGTPAISSAIQFVSLARFGRQVKFLVSNEYEPDRTELIASSNYLRGIQLQEAKALLERYDYSGVESLLKPYWLEASTPQQEKLKRLLKIAIQWNFANFQNFFDELAKLGEEYEKHWWRIGYEAAYLGVIRLKQGNTVEALFHSFRAVEGLICTWAEHKYEKHVGYKNDKKRSPFIKESIKNDFSKYIDELSYDMQKQLKRDGTLDLYSKSLYILLKAAKPECKSKTHKMNAFWGREKAKDIRNPLFHRLLGLEEEDVFDAWGAKDNSSWQTKVLNCLNFVAEQDFTSLKKSSLMHGVHEDLMQALVDYEAQVIGNR